MLRIKIAIGAPVVIPSKTPERSSASSLSRLCVTWREEPDGGAPNHAPNPFYQAANEADNRPLHNQLPARGFHQKWSHKSSCQKYFRHRRNYKPKTATWHLFTILPVASAKRARYLVFGINKQRTKNHPHGMRRYIFELHKIRYCFCIVRSGIWNTAFKMYTYARP